MKAFRRAAAFGLAVLIGAAGAAAQTPTLPGPAGKVMSLTLAECIEKALQSNLNLSLEALNPALAEESRRLALEEFLPTFSVQSQYMNRTMPTTWGLEAGEAIQYKYDNTEFSVTNRFVTGTELTLSGYSSRTDTTRSYTTVNPSYDSNVSLTLQQKLLKGFGPAVNRYQTTKAENAYSQSLGSLKTSVLSTVYQVEAAYWNLVSARERLRVIEASLAESRQTLDRDREAARIGAKTSVDVLDSETQVAQRESSLLSTKAGLEKAENALKILLNLPVETGAPGEGERTAIVPADKATVEKRAVTLEEAMRAARAERPEIANAKLQLADAGLAVRYNRNQLLPDLSLNLYVWNPGQSGIRYIYQDDNPLTGIVVDKVVGGRWDSFRDLVKKNYGNIQFTVNLNVPLGGIISRAALAGARLAQDKARLTLEKAQRDLEAEVVAAVKDLETAGRQIEASTRYRELMEKKVAAAAEKYRLGLVDREWLFTYQSSLDQAKSEEIAAFTAYKIALAKLEQVMGTTIKSKGLRFRGFDL